ncbi:helix-turn-helix domain-containing protein [Nocardioides sp. 1609]|uniref:helix-turn-helix domain-containing protein n=1 Tax=Nocardioides sp. 1609 TaxID=2508327 RepID=UPI0014322F32|nr:helix-turn-helix domain-containing protein [Nocardioides sp. 1609]
MLTITEAAAATSVSRDTIKRRLAEGTFPGATRGAGGGPGGTWRIPFDDLADAGLTSGPQPGTTTVGDTNTQLAVALAENRALRAHLADLRRMLVRTQ